MLVLSRRVGESIVIADDITITVLEFRGDVVRLGVDAPRSVQVRRQELLVELAETNRAAASPREGAVDALSALVAAQPQQSAPRPPAPAATRQQDGQQSPQQDRQQDRQRSQQSPQRDPEQRQQQDRQQPKPPPKPGPPPPR